MIDLSAGGVCVRFAWHGEKGSGEARGRQELAASPFRSVPVSVWVDAGRGIEEVVAAEGVGFAVLGGGEGGEEGGRMENAVRMGV